MDAAASIAIETAVKHVVEKIKRGKRLTTEDILVLYLGSISAELRTMRAEAAEREKVLREEIEQLRKEMYARFDATDAKIDAKIDELWKEMYAKFDALYAEMNRRFDEVNRRLDTIVTEFGRKFDELYRLLITALTQKKQE